MSRSAHGLSTGGGQDWRIRAACVGMDPEAFHPGDGALSAANRQALAACRDCPVRLRCRDWHLAVRPTPLSTIAGGWRWTGTGEVRPFRGEGHLVPSRDERPPAKPPKSGPSGRPTASAETGTRFITCGRELAECGDAGLVAARHKVSTTLVFCARAVIREAPELVDDVAAGRLAIGTAVRVMQQRRAAR